jgi:predicted TIM-barrel fold metal-dependent hydrolase
MVTEAARLRARLDHPIIDADGHLIEHLPALLPMIVDEGVAPTDLHHTLAAVVRPDLDTNAMTTADMVRLHIPTSTWWSLPSSALDLATVTAPRLYRKRLDEFGIDVAVVYASVGLGFVHVQHDDVRVPACRAYNRYVAEAFADVGDRIVPTAIIPMHTPSEAIDVLEHAVALGLRAVMIANYVRRPVPGIEPDAPGAPWAWWIDLLGVDSAYDYDPFWQRCIELGVAVSAHSGSMGVGFRNSPTNYMFNHTGHFGAAGEASARSLFLAGVTARFPNLRIAFLEGGVHWARGLLADLIARWEKRGAKGIVHYDPTNTDRALLQSLIAEHAPELVARSGTDSLLTFAPSNWPTTPADDFARARIDEPEQFLDRFVTPFFFGCEADDPMTPDAFDRSSNPLGARLQAMFSSDIGHWDVRDPTDVLPEAYEAVEHGQMSERDFRAFVFDHAHTFFTAHDPTFFRGTILG